MKIIKKLLKPLDKFSWDGNTGESIVLHTTLGNTHKGAEETLLTRHLSYHYIIDEKGTVRQMVNLNRSAWHAGVKHKPNLRARTFFGNDNPNKRSIGIAFVGTSMKWGGGAWMSKEQRDSCIKLIKEIGKHTGVRYNANNIFYHQEITSYKPQWVSKIRTHVVEGLVGFKDEKDNVNELTYLQLMVKLLRLKLQLLKQNAKQDN